MSQLILSPIVALHFSDGLVVRLRKLTNNDTLSVNCLFRNKPNKSCGTSKSFSETVPKINHSCTGREGIMEIIP